MEVAAAAERRMAAAARAVEAAEEVLVAEEAEVMATVTALMAIAALEAGAHRGDGMAGRSHSCSKARTRLDRASLACRACRRACRARGKQWRKRWRIFEEGIEAWRRRPCRCVASVANIVANSAEKFGFRHVAS